MPGGSYFRTYTNDGSGPHATADPATVSNFRLDKYAVTAGRFRQFVVAWNAGHYLPPPGSGKHVHLNGGRGLADSANPGTYEPGWVTADNANIGLTGGAADANLTCVASFATWTKSASSQDDLPINCVNWWDAYAFCIWDGGFLSTESEWEYAAAGGGELREYPWGTSSPGTTNEYAIYGCNYPSGPDSGCGTVSSIAPVGTPALGAGAWGHLDLEGDVWEWNLDWYAPYVTPCFDCAYLTTATNRVLRGASFNDPSSYLFSSNRNSFYKPGGRGYNLGFRCARTP